LLPRRVSSRRAAEVLRKVFGHIPAGFAFRLWDGTVVSLGQGAPVCTAVVHRPETFVRLIRDPTPLVFAEAYVEGAIDLEGDLFAAMTVANAIEEMRLSVTDRVRLLATLWRG
jgi:cyclopropane-fatty-acyl-phospholipid synthase